MRSLHFILLINILKRVALFDKNETISGRTLIQHESLQSTYKQVKEQATNDEYTATEKPISPRLTNDELFELLQSHGYYVKNFSDNSSPLAFMGDTAYYPEQLLANLPSAADRSNIQSKRLWLDASGRQQVWYYYDVQTQADEAVFEEAVKTWADTTCIKFNRGQRGGCSDNRGHGAVCVGDFGGCWSLVGNSYGNGYSKTSQKMSVQPRGCEMVAAAHEFGHALGLQHQQARPDRAEHIWVNYENLDLKMTGQLDQVTQQAWYQACMCSKDQMVDVPSPYDYMSLMQYAASDFANEDGRIVYAAQDAHHQYMMDYHRHAGIAQTHYDKLVINTAYKCTDLWRKMCSDNGQDGPKCLNGGFFSKNCKCECADGFTGSACGSKSGPLYPIQDRAKVMLDINAPGVVDLSTKDMDVENHGYILPGFVVFQFITVVVDAGHPRKISTIRVQQPFDAIADQLATGIGQENLLGNLAVADCQITGYFYWGDFKQNKVRTECISSVYNNEVPDRWPVLRGRNRTLSVVVVGALGKLFRDPVITLKAVGFKLHVEFTTNPALQLRGFQEAADDPGPLGEPTAESSVGGGGIAGIVIAVLVVLAVIGFGVAAKMNKLPNCGVKSKNTGSGLTGWWR